MLAIASAADEPTEIDMESLQRGSFIEPWRVKRHCGIFPEHGANAVEGIRLEEQLRFASMKLCKRIELYFETARGETVTVSMRGEGIAILTAEEQDLDSARREEQALAKFRDAVRRDQENDASALSDALRAERDRRISRRAFQVQLLSQKPPPEMKKKPVGGASRSRDRADAAPAGDGNGASERGDPAA